MRLIVDKGHVDSRLDSFVSDLSEGKVSRSYAKTLIDEAKVFVNAKPCKASYKLKLNDLVEFEIPEPKSLEVLPENIPLNIVYEDDHLMVIDKPINMVTHPAPGAYSGTLVNAILYHVQATGAKLSDINGVLRPGIVHRLDKDTSGLIVVAKSNEAHKSLSEQIENRTCKRVYNALVHENIKEDQGVINRAIGRHPVDRLKMACFESTNVKNNAREARTSFKVLERFVYQGKNYTLVECKLDTGRTHQIRVHLSWMKRPILGDFTYSAPTKIPFNLNRPLLHAVALSFTHPVTGELMDFESPLASDFQRILDILRVG